MHIADMYLKPPCRVIDTSVMGRYRRDTQVKSGDVIPIRAGKTPGKAAQPEGIDTEVQIAIF
jgi:hypothetical protein